MRQDIKKLLKASNRVLKAWDEIPANFQSIGMGVHVERLRKAYSSFGKADTGTDWYSVYSDLRDEFDKLQIRLEKLGREVSKKKHLVKVDDIDPPVCPKCGAPAADIDWEPPVEAYCDSRECWDKDAGEGYYWEIGGKMMSVHVPNGAELYLNLEKPKDGS